MDYQKHLKFYYGHKDRLRASLCYNLSRYELIVSKTEKVLARINDIKCLIDKCDKDKSQLTYHEAFELGQRASKQKENQLALW